MKQKPILEAFINPQQAAALKWLMADKEEGAFHREKVREVQEIVNNMPVTYETQTEGKLALARLHYFKGSIDSWIVELDKGTPDDEPEDYQRQAFGVQDIGFGPELGYISIPELLAAGMELDLFYTPQTIEDILQG